MNPRWQRRPDVRRAPYENRVRSNLDLIFFERCLMTTIMPMDEPRPRGSIMGQWNGPTRTEPEHFARCPLCGGYVDMRDRVLLDVHQGPLPHPACDRAQ
jgi:hypothetical protein